MSKNGYVITAYNHISYRFLDTNSFEEVLSFCVPTVLAFILTCELVNPKYIIGSAHIITQKGRNIDEAFIFLFVF